MTNCILMALLLGNLTWCGVAAEAVPGCLAYQVASHWLSTMAFQASQRRLSKPIRWENGGDEMLWRLALDGVALPGDTRPAHLALWLQHLEWRGAAAHHPPPAPILTGELPRFLVLPGTVARSVHQRVEAYTAWAVSRMQPVTGHAARWLPPATHPAGHSHACGLVSHGYCAEQPSGRHS